MMAAGDHDDEFCSAVSESILIDTVGKVKTQCPMCLVEEFPTVPNKLDVISSKQDDEAKDVIVSCTNEKGGCTWRGDIQAMEEHKKACPHEMVECEYHSVGCKAKVQRRDLKDHNKANIEEHLALSMSRLGNLERLVHLFVMNEICGPCGIHFIEEEWWSMGIEPLAMMSTAGDKVCPVILKMPQFAAKKAADEKWFSEPFYTHNKGYKMCLCVDTASFDVSIDNSINISDPKKSVALHVMKGPHDDKLSWPLRGELEIALLNQLDDYRHCGVTIEYDDNTPAAAVCRVVDTEIASTGFGGDGIRLDVRDSSSSSPSFSSSSDSSDEKDPDWLYLKDDCMFFQVLFEND